MQLDSHRPENKRWWLGWFQPGEDYRPLTHPPNEYILGWWCSGESATGDATLCAWVSAPTKQAAWEAVKKDWPDMGQERFGDHQQDNFSPGDRFPLSDWMKLRAGL